MKQHELYASMRVELPEDPRQFAKMVAEVTTAWASMLEAIGLEVEAPISINEVRAKVTRKPRRPRLVPPPSGEAA